MGKFTLLRLCILGLLVGALLPGFRAEAGVVGSPHDFSRSSLLTTYQTNPIAASGVCSVCHVPHNARYGALWPRDLLSSYDNDLRMDGETGSPSDLANYKRKITVQCYDCHDYHAPSGGGVTPIDTFPPYNSFATNHKPQNIAFGFTTPASGRDSNSTMKEDPPAGLESGYYENNPPFLTSPQLYFGADSSSSSPFHRAIDNAVLARSGGHYFKSQDPTPGSVYRGDKLPCSDCHDPHAWDSVNKDWHAFFRPPKLYGGSRWSQFFSSSDPIASTYMANPADLPGERLRNDLESRKMCILCHGTSDSFTNRVSYNDINSSYSSTAKILYPPGTVAEHASTGPGSGVACVSCHNHNYINPNCASCHGFPPNPYSPARNPTPPSWAYSTRDPHPQHTGRADGQPLNSFSPYGFTCAVCHATSALGSRTILGVHKDTHYNIAYDLSGLGVPNPPDVESPTGLLICSNVYCHSNGGADNTMGGAGNYYRTVQWGVTPAPLLCNECHGVGTTPGTPGFGMPNYTSGPVGSPTANIHPAHVVDGGYECSVCHFDTAAGTYRTARTIRGTSTAYHVNGRREVVFDNTNAIGSYDNTNKSCDVSCHGLGKPAPGRPRWGGSLPFGCFDCHAGTEQVFKPQLDPGLPNPVDNAEYLWSGHGRSSSSVPPTYPGSGNLPAGFSNYTTAPVACYVCHSQTAAHTTKSPNDPFRLGSVPDNTLGGSGGAGGFTGAFADNTDALCLACHGTAAQRSGHDNVAAKGTTTVDAQTHARGITGTKYNWPLTPWKCVDCHDPHGDGKGGADRYMMIRSGINAPIDNTDANAGSDGKSRPKRTDANVRPVGFNSLLGYSTTAGVYSYAQSGNGPTWGPCEVCHTQTATFSRNRDNLGPHVSRTNRCVSCHPHTAGFEGTPCRGCHGPVAVVPGAPDVGRFWTSSGHGRFTPASLGRAIDCEDCHDTSYLTPFDHKTAGVPGSPPLNINTLSWPGKSPLNADTNPNANTSHLVAGYIDNAATSRQAIARKFDNQCATAPGCHATDYHRHQMDNNPPGVMRFGDRGTRANPKQYNWYSWDTSNPVNYPVLFYQSLSAWADNDIRAVAGMSDPTVNYGLCVTCHDPHGTGVTNTSGYPGLGTTNHMLRGNWLPPTGPATFCNSPGCHG